MNEKIIQKAESLMDKYCQYGSQFLTVINFKIDVEAEKFYLYTTLRKMPSDYDYFKQEDIDMCLADLIDSKIGLSRRHGCQLNIDWSKTPNNQPLPAEKHWPESSNVMGAKYLKNEGILRVSFKNGSVYDYEDVPETLWAEMVVAESSGAFLAKRLKGKHKASRFN